MDLKNTLNLPDPNFTIPMKADLPKQEPAWIEKWTSEQIYHEIQNKNEFSPSFVLHFGPPYTNSAIHFGTAVNNILKDFVVKSKTMQGFRCPVIPGFDNHGLPIEQTVMKSFQEKKEQPTVSQLIDACRKHADKYIQIQKDQIHRLGVLGLWEKPYFTMNFKYEAEIIRTFNRLVEKGFIYRGLRPVIWSPTCKTALADTEIVYHEVVSNSIFVRFALKKDLNNIFSNYPKLYGVIWTTTPWTLPANVALAFHPDYTYSIVEYQGAHYLFLKDSLSKTIEKLGWEGFKTVGSLKGCEIENCVFQHPFLERDSLAVMVNYVTTEDGTGIVHTAPGHGRDDFYTGQKYNLPILCPVDESGMLTEEAGPYANLYYKKAEEKIIQDLQETGDLLFTEKYTHSYPHAERDDKPVIYRTTEQWFLNVEHENLRERMLDEISKVRWVPESGRKRIEAMIGGRPDWCISRQRPWGVGIPIFYGKKSRVPVLDSVAIEAVAQLVEKQGCESWHTTNPEDILPQGYKHPQTGEEDFVKETDVFDVWFDSACTQFCVLEKKLEPEWTADWPADIYLEGSDQHRGWFNTSLILGVALKGRAPFKEVVTHGFIVDQQGRKFSKRLGNSVELSKVCEAYGADILRYWAATIDYKDDISCSESIIKQCSEGYRRIRNTLRFLLSNLYDYDGTKPEGLLEVDQWILTSLKQLNKDCQLAYNNYSFHSVTSQIYQFCAQQVSAIYADTIKDRMYCDGKNWDSRRSAQYTCHQILLSLVKLLAPILSFTCEEVYAKIPHIERLKSVHLERFDTLEDHISSELLSKYQQFFNIRSQVFAQFEIWKESSEIKDSQDIIARVALPLEDLNVLKGFGQDLPLFFKMSDVVLSEGDFHVEFSKSPYLKCERSRLRRQDVGMYEGVPLSARDQMVLLER